MYADRSQRGHMSPTGLTLAVGINAALLAALIFSSPEIVEQIDWKPMEATNVLLPPPPPPPKPEARKPVDTPASTEISIKPPIVDLRPPPIDLVGTTDPPPFEPIRLGSGTGSVTVDPPKSPPPVMAGAEIDPRYADALQPEYPADMRRTATEGQVVVKVLIGTDGRVKQIALVSSPSDSFFSATRRQALSRWRFKPATRDGVPYESWKTMSLRFTLVDG